MSMQEPESLSYFGTAFENKCIFILLNDKRFLEKVFDILEPSYFEKEAHKWLIKIIKDYYIQYKNLVTLNVLEIKLKDIPESNRLLQYSIVDALEKIFTHQNDIDLNYVKDRFLEFCKRKALGKAILKSVDLLKQGDYDSIKVEIDNALKAGMEKDVGHSYFDDLDVRLCSYNRNPIKTGLSLIDKVTDGGLGSGELGFVIASSGIGKSWVLCNIGKSALLSKKNVLHITLELNQDYVGLRYDCLFTGIPFRAIKNNRQNIEKTLSEIKKDCGSLYIKFFSLKSISALSIKLFIERLQLLINKKIDMLIVDYADLLKPVDSFPNNKYEEAGSVYEELRAIASELNIPVWTASQSNREGAKSEIVNGEDVAESYKKIMTGDLIFSLSRTPADVISKKAKIFIIKNRFGPDKILSSCYFDSDNGKLETEVVVPDNNSNQESEYIKTPLTE